MSNPTANSDHRQWIASAIQKIHADFNRSADTHMIKIDLPFTSDIQLYLKDESTHPTGSLKHRLARSLYLYAICNGNIGPNTTVVESSSGSTAISEAYFAKLLGLKFIAVVPKNTAQEKIDQIKHYDGQCHLVEPNQIYQESQRLAQELDGHYMDQFTNAERATDWRGNNNIAQSIFEQLQEEPAPIPSYIVVSAGTGGTSATIGRFIRYNPNIATKTKLLVVDPENSVFIDYFNTGNPDVASDRNSRIEGIGRPRVEPSFVPQVVDQMLRVKDEDSIAAIHFLEKILGRKCGGSTGTNLIGAFTKIAQMHQNKQKGSVVTLLCDSGQRYLDCYYDTDWIKSQNLQLDDTLSQLNTFYQQGPSDQTPLFTP